MNSQDTIINNNSLMLSVRWDRQHVGIMVQICSSNAELMKQSWWFYDLQLPWFYVFTFNDTWLITTEYMFNHSAFIVLHLPSDQLQTGDTGTIISDQSVWSATLKGAQRLHSLIATSQIHYKNIHWLLTCMQWLNWTNCLERLFQLWVYL